MAKFILPVNLKTEPRPVKQKPNASQPGLEPIKPLLSRKKKPVLKLMAYLSVFGVIVFAAFSSRVIMSDQSSTSWLARLPIIRELKHLAESADKKLKGEKNDRTNILLLGMGGKNHEGSYLTDTIILASLQPSTKKVSLVSLPRDLVVPMENMGWKKINSVNAFAEMNTPGSGGLAVSQALADLSGQPVDYYVRVDFTAFVNIIDRLGGVEIDVERAFDDYRYPILGRESAEPYESRFEHLHFEQGAQIMDGAAALKYARSRHAAGPEGSDFARTKRQQKIIQAVKDKLLSSQIVFDPALIADIFQELKENISTNLKIWEMYKLWQIGKEIDSQQIITKVVDNSPNGLLIDSISDQGAYVLTPRSGDFAEIQYFIANIFTDAPLADKSKVISEHASVEVRNGTWINGLASQVALDLEKFGFRVVRIGNSNRQNFQKTVIYDLTYGEKSEALEVLRSKTEANVSPDLPEWLMTDINADVSGQEKPVQPDFILVLGQEADMTKSGKENPDD